ncbi:hypothetical protein MPSEU_000607500 [Mayamaea pseudoterrestris]|nr:hypothetical protein MPSEU_000607500 [Mayamaea pseudoterrestris]
MSDARSQYERKLARQRQMELMEAAASGTIPSMELDTALAEAQLRSRTEEARLQQQQQQQQLLQSRETGMRTTQLFERPDTIRPSVNLMDHDAGIYQEPKTLREQIGSMFKNLLVRSEYDASPSDDYIGQKPRRRTSKTRGTNLYANCVVLVQRNRTLCGLFIMILFVVVITATTVSYFKARPEKVLIQKNSVRHTQIEELVLAQGFSHPDALQDPNSADYHAIRWIAYGDQMRLRVDDPFLFQRYALAVFFYGSYFSFQKRAGVQDFDQKANLAEGVPNPGWTRHDNWLSEKGYCTWYGVECKQREVDGSSLLQYDDNADIITLELSSNQVMGTLPISFKALDNMSYLDLAYNKLAGTFPYQIARIFKMQHLLLNNNAMTGTLPTYMGQLEQIRELRFNNNKFGGTIPTEVNRMLNIKIFEMQNNELTGPFPEIKDTKKLTVLDLSENKLTGTIPYVIGFLKELETLRLSNNLFTGECPVELNNVQSLQILEADHNMFNGTLRDLLFERLKNLRVINFQHNQLVGTLPTPIGLLKHVEEVSFNNNNFIGPMPIWKEAYALRKIHIQENSINSFLPKGFCKLNNLEELWMNDNQFSGPVHPQWGNLTKLVNLQLENNLLTGALPPTLASLSSLQRLRLQGNQMAGTMTAEVCELTRTGMLKSVSVDCAVECDCCGGSCF